MPPTAPSENRVRFILGGEVHTIDGVDPNTTVLQYLREHIGRLGTKEGCAEGDCGACTVVVAELESDSENPQSDSRDVKLRAVNSCIKFLATLDGKELITVEDLEGTDGRLHPAQHAMVNEHGSQCGFCTPGFVMSLVELHQRGEYPGRDATTDALAGNLCRCTGYRPILAAAESMFTLEGAGIDIDSVAGRLRTLQHDRTVGQIGTSPVGTAQTYLAPTTADELAALYEAHPDAHLLAGGTDVGLWVTKQHRDLGTILYLGDIVELQGIRATPSHLEIGAGATLTDAMPFLAAEYPDFGELLRRFASPPIRNAATLVGNIANGSPIGDSMPALLALDAEIDLRRGDRRRSLRLDRFYLGYRENALEPGEWIEGVRIPRAGAQFEFRTYKVSKRFDQDISSVCGAFRVQLEQGKVRDARVAFGGMAAVPARASECEAQLKGRDWNEGVVARAMSALDRDFEPIDDMRSSAAYRREIARNLLFKFYLETTEPSDTPTRLVGGGPRTVHFPQAGGE